MNNLLKKVKEFFIKIKELLSKTKPFFEKIGEFLSPVKAFYKKHFDILNPIVVLTVICIVIAAALSVTNSLTASRIAEMEFSKQEAEKRALLPADTYAEHTLSDFESDANFSFYSAESEGKTIGYLVTTSAKGYGGDIVIMTAFLPSGEIKSISILNADSETPGLGQNVTKEAFYSQFTGTKDKATVVKSAADKEKSEISAVTGATISSRGAVKAVNTAREALNAYLATPGLETSTSSPESGTQASSGDNETFDLGGEVVNEK